MRLLRPRSFCEGGPKGSRNQATIVAQSVLDGQAKALIEKVVQLALEGDLSCLKICAVGEVEPRIRALEKKANSVPS